MVVAAIDQTCVNLCIMNRNMRPSPSVAVLAAKPPKPPCWRDFVSPTKYQAQSPSDSEFTDISKVAKSSNESTTEGFFSNKQGKQKRVRARIHRTRSQFTIAECDLPEETLTVTLAETKPDDLGLGRETAFDERIFQEDNNRKCQTWLQGIEACKPLEEVVSYDLNYVESDDVKNDVRYKKLVDIDAEDIPMEIPDDTLWYDSTVLHSQCDSSDSDSDPEYRHTKKSALHRSRTQGRLKGPMTSSDLRDDCVQKTTSGKHTKT